MIETQHTLVCDRCKRRAPLDTRGRTLEEARLAARWTRVTGVDARHVELCPECAEAHADFLNCVPNLPYPHDPARSLDVLRAMEDALARLKDGSDAHAYVVDQVARAEAAIARRRKDAPAHPILDALATLRKGGGR